MNPFTKTFFAAVVMLICSSLAFAEDRLGVPVYPGAEYDAVRTKQLLDSMSVKGAAYRTRDAIGKVTAFYQQQGLLLLKLGGSLNEVARFKKMKTNVDIVVQSPWTNRKTGATMTDTLILIFKKVEQKGKPDVAI